MVWPSSRSNFFYRFSWARLSFGDCVSLYRVRVTRSLSLFLSIHRLRGTILSRYIQVSCCIAVAFHVSCNFLFLNECNNPHHLPPHSLVRNQSFTHFYRFHHFSCFFLFSLSLFLDFSFHSLTSSPFLHPTQLHSSPLSSTHILPYPSFLLPHFFHSLVFVGGVVLLDFEYLLSLSLAGF